MPQSWDNTDASLALKMEKVQQYLKQQGIFELFEDLTTALIYHLPDDSKAFLSDAILLLRDNQLNGPDAKPLDLKTKLSAKDYSIPDQMKAGLGLTKDASKQQKARARPKSAKPSLTGDSRRTTPATTSNAVSQKREVYTPASANRGASPSRPGVQSRSTTAATSSPSAGVGSAKRATFTPHDSSASSSAAAGRPGSASAARKRPTSAKATIPSRTAAGGAAQSHDPIARHAASASTQAVEAAVKKSIAAEARDELAKEIESGKAIKMRRALPREAKPKPKPAAKKQLPLRTVQAKQQAKKAEAVLAKVVTKKDSAGRPVIEVSSDETGTETDDSTISEDEDDLGDEVMKGEKKPTRHRLTKDEKKQEKVQKRQAEIAVAKKEVKLAKKAEKEVRRAEHIAHKAAHNVKKQTKPVTATNTKAPAAKQRPMVKTTDAIRKKELAAKKKSNKSSLDKAIAKAGKNSKGASTTAVSGKARAVQIPVSKAGKSGPAALQSIAAIQQEQASPNARTASPLSMQSSRGMSGVQAASATQAAIAAEKAATAARKANKPPKCEVKKVTREEQADLDNEEKGLFSRLKVVAPPPSRVAKVRRGRPRPRGIGGRDVVVPGMSRVKVPGQVNMDILQKAQTASQQQAAKAKANKKAVKKAEKAALKQKQAVQAAKVADAAARASAAAISSQAKKGVAGPATAAVNASAKAAAKAAVKAAGGKKVSATATAAPRTKGRKAKAAARVPAKAGRAPAALKVKSGITARPAVAALLGSSSEDDDSSTISDTSESSSESSGVINPAPKKPRAAVVKGKPAAVSKAAKKVVGGKAKATTKVLRAKGASVLPARRPRALASDSTDSDETSSDTSIAGLSAAATSISQSATASAVTRKSTRVKVKAGVVAPSSKKVSATIGKGITARPSGSKKKGAVIVPSAAAKKGSLATGKKPTPPAGVDSSTESSASTDEEKFAAKAVRAEKEKAKASASQVKTVYVAASSESSTTDAESEVDESVSSDETDDLAGELEFAKPVRKKGAAAKVAAPPVKVKRVRASKPNKPRHVRKKDAPSKSDVKAAQATPTAGNAAAAARKTAGVTRATTSATAGFGNNNNNNNNRSTSSTAPKSSMRPTSAGYSRPGAPSSSGRHAHFQQSSSESSDGGYGSPARGPSRATIGASGSAVESVQPFTSHSKPQSIKVTPNRSGRPGSAGRARKDVAGQGKKGEKAVNPVQASKQAAVATDLGPLVDSYTARPTQFQRLFATMDTDRDGSISVKEFVNALKHRAEILGFEKGTAGRLGEIQAFKKLDKNGDGRISWDEFTASMQTVTNQVKHERELLLISSFEQNHGVFAEVFGRLPKDSKKGVLIADMVKALSAPDVLKKLGLKPDQVTALTSAESFKAVDSNKDGRITWEELLSSIGELHEGVKKTQVQRIGDRFSKQTEGFRKLFDKVDRNRNGSVSFLELVHGLGEHAGLIGLLKRDMGVFTEVDAFKRFDSDGDGQITWEEFKSGMIALVEASKSERQKALATSYKTKPSQYKKLFTKLDKNKDGAVSFQEFVSGMKTMGGALGLTAAEAKSMAQISAFREMDTDGDGTISWPEFQAGMNRVVQDARNAKVAAVGKVYRENAIEFKEVFTSLPKDKNGNVVMLDFVNALKKNAGLIGLSPEDIDVLREADVFKKLDKDNNGAISWAEFQLSFATLVVSAENDKKKKFLEKFDSLEEEFRAMFKKFDRDHNGQLSKLEFLTALKSYPDVVSRLGADASAGLAHMDIFRRADTDGNGSLSWAEFSAAIRQDAAKEEIKKESKMTSALLARNDLVKSLFRELDMNGDGSISTAELVKGLKKSPELIKLVQQNGGEVAAMSIFKAADSDQSGAVSHEEFRSYLLGVEQETESQSKTNLADAYRTRQRLFRDIFTRLDKTKSGKVTSRDFVHELKADPACLSEIGLPGAKALSELDLFKRADRDKDGFVTWDEFSRTMEGLVMDVDQKRNVALSDAFAAEEMQFKELFASLDKNRDGSISTSELALGISAHPVLAQKLKGENIKLTSLFSRADKDKNGKLSFAEFKAEMQSVRAATLPGRIDDVATTFKKNEKEFDKLFDRASKGDEHVSPVKILKQIEKQGAALGLSKQQVSAIHETREFNKASKNAAVDKAVKQAEKADAAKGRELTTAQKKARQATIKEMKATAPPPEPVSREEFREMMAGLQVHRETKKRPGSSTTKTAAASPSKGANRG